jgi:type IV secretory pathway component VirB8
MDPVTFAIVAGSAATVGSLVKTLVVWFIKKKESYTIKIEDKEIEVSANQLTKAQIAQFIELLKTDETLTTGGESNE